MILVRAQYKVATAPKTVVSCLRALGVKVLPSPSFWVEYCAELDWILKDAHRAWRQRLIASHPDYNGTHEEAAYWNAVWAQIEKSFRWHGVTLGGRVLPLVREVPVPSDQPRTSRTAVERKAHRREYIREFTLKRYRLKAGIPLTAQTNSWYAGKPSARAALFLLSAFCSLLSAFADGPDLNQHVWRSNGMIYVSVHVLACHVARFERVVVLPSTNWHETALSAGTVDEEPFTRLVVFSESLSLFPKAFYRVHILRVSSCADIMGTVSTCAK